MIHAITRPQPMHIALAQVGERKRAKSHLRIGRRLPHRAAPDQLVGSYFAAFFCAAQRFFCAAEMRALASALSLRRLRVLP